MKARWTVICLLTGILLASGCAPPATPTPPPTTVAVRTAVVRQEPTRTPAPTAHPIEEAPATARPTRTDSPTPPPAATLAPPLVAPTEALATTAPHTPTPLPGPVVYLEAPEAVLDAWHDWNGRYVLYAHAGVTKLEDLNGKTLCAFVPGSSFADMLLPVRTLEDRLQTSGIDISSMFYLDISPDEGLLQDKNCVGVMAPEIAASFRFYENDSLVRVEFR